MSGTENHVLRYACTSLGEIVRCGPLPVIFVDGTIVNHPILGTVASNAIEGTSLISVIEKLEKIMRETTDNIVRLYCID